MSCRYVRFALLILLSVSFIGVQAVHARKASVTPSESAVGRSVSGEVIKVDTETRSMTLRSGPLRINLDISNPVLQGYGSLTAIKKGDRVGVAYTAFGIRITKLPKTGADEKAPPEALETRPAKKAKKPSPFARKERVEGRSFTSVDNNKDGKISPIELSVVIPDLTVEQFRQYDKNHDGHLDRAEFEQIRLP